MPRCAKKSGIHRAMLGVLWRKHNELSVHGERRFVIARLAIKPSEPSEDFLVQMNDGDPFFSLLCHLPIADKQRDHKKICSGFMIIFIESPRFIKEIERRRAIPP